ncbi:RipA family octameric membrane protein [Micromonospora sp. I033]
MANAADPPGTPEPDRIDRALMPQGAPTSNEDKTQLFELYKMMVQTSEALVARRQGTNTFFLTANGLLLTAIGLFVRQGANARRHGLVIAILCLTGLIVAWGWRTLLISFGQLNKGKFAVILRMEKALTASIFDAEWEALDRGENKRTYRSFTESEKRVPAVFMAIYGIAFVIGLLIALDWLPL